MKGFARLFRVLKWPFLALDHTILLPSAYHCFATLLCQQGRLNVVEAKAETSIISEAREHGKKIVSSTGFTKPCTKGQGGWGGRRKLPQERCLVGVVSK
jgi:hypothetical protein